MLAAFRAARKNNHSMMPRELVTGLQCRGWGTLPRHGGYLDQPAMLMLWMTRLVNIWQATRNWVTSDDWPKFVRKQPDDWELVSQLITLEKEHAANVPG